MPVSPNKYDLAQLDKIGSKTLGLLNKLGLKSILDLLFHFPYRYERYDSPTSLDSLQNGQNVIITGTIDLIRNKKSFRKKMAITEALLSNDSGSLEIIWFNQAFITKIVKAGDRLSLAGKIVGYQGRLVMVSPNYEKIFPSKTNIHTNCVVPIYGLTAGLTQKQVRYFVSQALKAMPDWPEYLPDSLVKKYRLPDIKSALRNIHFPADEASLQQALYRLKFSELFIFRLKSYLLKHHLNKKIARPLEIKVKQIKKFIASLPFELTADQKKAAWAILRDTEKEKAMSRLLQGDVGSGKTIVAIIAMLNCAQNRQQSALMAPTEILATQHYETFQKFLKPFRIKLALLTAKNQRTNFPIKGDSRKLYSEIVQRAQIVIGTHSLIQDRLKFKNLSLVIVDEQHRFGVNQRQEIMEKNIDDHDLQSTPHFLSMTATPIPRSLALMSFFDLDFSLISEKPKDRPKIETKIIKPQEKPAVYDFIKSELEKGHQAFIICPLIDPSDQLGATALKSEYHKLKNNEFKDTPIALIHGRMKNLEQEKTMKDFLANKTKVLLATSIAEIGLDIPRATVILIEGAERFGLAQLHQFRGRVGRSNLPSYCFLSLSQDSPGNSGLKRLQVLQKYQDGLSLAKMDLKFRGSGDFYGTLQSGLSNFKLASLFDHEIIAQVENEVKILSQSDPELKSYPILRKKIKKKTDQTHWE